MAALEPIANVRGTQQKGQSVSGPAPAPKVPPTRPEAAPFVC